MSLKVKEIKELLARLKPIGFNDNVTALLRDRIEKKEKAAIGRVGSMFTTGGIGVIFSATLSRMLFEIMMDHPLYPELPPFYKVWQFWGIALLIPALFLFAGWLMSRQDHSNDLWYRSRITDGIDEELWSAISTHNQTTIDLDNYLVACANLGTEIPDTVGAKIKELINRLSERDGELSRQLNAFKATMNLDNENGFPILSQIGAGPESTDAIRDALRDDMRSLAAKIEVEHALLDGIRQTG